MTFKTTSMEFALVALALGACDVAPPESGDLGSQRASALGPVEGDAGPGGVLARLEVAPISDTEAVAFYTFESPPPVSSFASRFGEGAVVNDAGEGFDDKAADGVYTGVIPMSSEEIDDKRAAFLERVGMEKSPQIMRFRGRAALGREAFDPSGLPKPSERWIAALGQAVPSSTIFPSSGGGSVGTLAGLPPTADPLRSLVVLDPRVVRDPNNTGVWQWSSGQCVQVGNPFGPWGFVGLMDDVGNGQVSAHDLIIGWLGEMAIDRTVNGQLIQGAGQGVQTITDGDPNNTNAIAWPKFFDDGNPSTLFDTFDLSQTPVQLIAIVNRTDLAASGYGAAQDGQRAELRFVFTFIDEETCRPSLGGFILEYDVPIDDCAGLEDYFTDWHGLSALQLGSPGYNAALEAITAPITAAGAGPGRPNDSNLKVLRTNEANIRFPEYPNTFPSGFQSSWDMQEFAVDPDTALLANQPVAQTPAYGYELPDWNSATLEQEVDLTMDVFAADIVAGQYVVPLTDPLTGDPMRGASAMYGRFRYPSTATVKYVGHFPGTSSSMDRLLSWGSANVGDLEARQRFSLQTCSGCHYGETFEDGDGTGSFENLHVGASTPGGVLEEPFRHIRPDANLANPAHLSRFMTGTNATCGPDEFVAPLGALASCASPGCCPIGDPVFGYQQGQVHYNEFHRRGSILEDVVTLGCGALDGHAFAEVVVSSAH